MNIVQKYFVDTNNNDYDFRVWLHHAIMAAYTVVSNRYDNNKNPCLRKATRITRAMTITGVVTCRRMITIR